MTAHQIQEILNGTRLPETVSEAEWDAVGAFLVEQDARGETDLLTASLDDIDRQIISEMPQAPVPSGLHDRLLGLFPAEDAGDVAIAAAPEAAPVRKIHTTRRGFFGLTACVTIAGLFWLFGPVSLARYEVDQLANALGTTDVAALEDASTQADEVVADALPAWFGSSLRFSDAKQFRIGDDILGTAYRFTARGRHGQTLRGRLLALPNERVEGVPYAEWFTAADPKYVRTGSADFVTTSWTDGTHTFVCAVELTPGVDEPLDQLEALLTGRIA